MFLAWKEVISNPCHGHAFSPLPRTVRIAVHSSIE